MIFEVPLADGRVVYMRGSECDTESIIWVSTEKFVHLWHDSQKLDKKRTAEKYPDIESIFAQSAQYPVSIYSAGMLDYDGDGISKIKLTDGITRTTWLINNGAHSFPLACSPSQVQDFLREVSTKSAQYSGQSNRPVGNGLGKLGPKPIGLAGKLSSILRLFKKLY